MSVRSLSVALVLGLGLGLVSSPIVAAPAFAVDGAPVQLAIAVPIVAPAGTTGLISATSLAQYTSPFGLLTRELDAVINRPVALAIDPMIIVSIRILGRSAPDSALAWLDRLSNATNETFPLTYADSDLTLAMQAGSPTVIKPESFDFAIDSTLFAPASTTTATPSPTAPPTNQALTPLPTTDDLLSWPYSVSGIAWPRDDTVTAADIPKIATSGFSSTILSSTNVSVSASAGPTVTVEGSRILISDSSVSGSLRAASESLGTEDWQTELAALGSAISAAGSAQGGSQPTVFATLDRSVPVSGTRLADTLAGIAANSAVTLVPLSQALDLAPGTASVVDTPQDPERVAAVSRMLEAKTAEHQFAGIAADPQRITSPRQLALLALLANSWLSNPTGWNSGASDFVTTSSTLRGSVQLVRSGKFLLVADNDQYLPITVGNTLDQPVTVYISARAGSGLLLIADPLKELVIPAKAQAKVDVPVRSLTNGVVSVHVSLVGAAGQTIGSSISTQVNVQAGWETPIVVAIAVLVFLVFGLGIVRTIVKRRRAVSD